MSTKVKKPRYKVKEYITLKGRSGVFVITNVIVSGGGGVVYQVKPADQYFVTDSDITKTKNNK